MRKKYRPLSNKCRLVNWIQRFVDFTQRPEINLEMSSGKSTLLSFCHGIERYLNAPPLNKGLKLSYEARFKRSNEILNATVVSLKRQGKVNVKPKPVIENEDLVWLKSSQVLSLSNPLAFLRNAWFHVVLFFCRRGREGHVRGTLKRPASSLKQTQLVETR